ncbi:MAG TPA: molybdopterin cofactor-binding domain-containing protein, partial [Vicinamibacteria bacterium]|nr:molybdopterin cofactor-binding domain-containing protein [Vicinamibacteria bacterium]
MSEDRPDFEPERYELPERLPYRFEVERRRFLQLLGGVAVLIAGRDASAQETGRPGPGEGGTSDLAAWLHVAEDGSVTVYTGKVEVGQNARTSLTQAVAEELRAPVGSIRLVMGDTDLTPVEMGTFGSRTTPLMAPQLRRAAAVARELLVELAARQWGLAPGALAVADGQVTHAATSRAIGFGALTKGQKLVKTIGDDVALTPPERWSVIGRSLPKVGGREIVTGRHRYTSDVTRPGMWHGKVLRPPGLGATLSSVDTAAAAALPNVVVVRDAGFAGVAAPSA